jgi:hypothetical protein
MPLAKKHGNRLYVAFMEMKEEWKRRILHFWEDSDRGSFRLIQTEEAFD